MLSAQQRESLRRDGYLLLPNAVPAELVDAALRTINARIGEGIPADDLPIWRAQSWFPELKAAPAITDLYNASAVGETVSELLGGHARTAASGQLALRFPLPVGTQAKKPGPHIDGVHSPTNGVTKGTLASFTALVGVFLTPLTCPDAGNFCVWPGSHRLMEAYFQQHGIGQLLEGQTPRLDYGDPIQIEAQPGDAVIAHYQLLHGVAQNAAPTPRFATFFRVFHPAHHENRLDCLTNLWREWPGVSTP